MGVSLTVPGIDVRLTLSALAMLAGDPTIRLGETSMTRATVTPDGPGAIRAEWSSDRGEVSLTGYDAGGSWLVDRGASLVGAADDASAFSPTVEA